MAKDLGAEIAKELTIVQQKADKVLEREINKAANDTVKLLKTTSPVGRRGKYQRSWAKKKNGQFEQVIYNKIPGLPHLLEKGHALRKGGRTAAQPHIKPAEQQMIKGLTIQIEKGLKV